MDGVCDLIDGVWALARGAGVCDLARGGAGVCVLARGAGVCDREGDGVEGVDGRDDIEADLT